MSRLIRLATAETSASAPAADTNEEATEGADAPEAAAPPRYVGPRDPFWPVGYVPPPPKGEDEPEEKPPEEEKEPEIQIPIEWPAIVPKGITKDRRGNYLAIIHGAGLVEAGDIISMTRNGLRYRWKITAIDDAGIFHKKLDVTPVTNINTEGEEL